MEVQGRSKRGGHKRRWLDRVKVVSKKKGLSGRKCTTEQYGVVYRKHKLGNKMKRKKKKKIITQSLSDCVSAVFTTETPLVFGRMVSFTGHAYQYATTCQETCLKIDEVGDRW